jgi:hypothetical protein
MVMAGMRNRKAQGVNKKKLSRLANPASKMLKGPLNTHRNRPLRMRKIPMAKYPMAEVKKDRTSRLKIANMFVVVLSVVIVGTRPLIRSKDHGNGILFFICPRIYSREFIF